MFDLRTNFFNRIKFQVHDTKDVNILIKLIIMPIREITGRINDDYARNIYI